MHKAERVQYNVHRILLGKLFRLSRIKQYKSSYEIIVIFFTNKSNNESSK